MNKQRIAVLLCSVIGMFSVFMPWAHTIIPGLKNLNGMSRYVNHGGWYILSFFAVPFALSLLGKHSEPLKKIPYYIVTGIGLFIFLTIIVEMIRFKFGGWLQGTIASLGWGLSVVALCGILLSLLATVLKGKAKKEPDNTKANNTM